MTDPQPYRHPHPTPDSNADRLTLFVRKDCHLCAAALQILQPLAQRWSLALESEDIDDPRTDPVLRAHYDHAVPVLHYKGWEVARHRIDEPAVDAAIAFSRVSFCVLAKYPTPGKVKTRLTVGDAAVTAAQAADVHRTFLLHLLRRLIALHPASVVLAFDPPDAHEVFAKLINNGAVHLTPQPPGDLGARLVAAHERATQPTLFLGTDAPDIPIAHLLEAAKLLLSQEFDAVLGPTADGGYWTIGVKPPAVVGLREVLHSIPWSSGQEFAATVERFGSLGYRCGLVSEWSDVDHPFDLHSLRVRLSGPGVSREDALLNESLRTLLSGNPL